MDGDRVKKSLDVIMQYTLYQCMLNYVDLFQLEPADRMLSKLRPCQIKFHTESCYIITHVVNDWYNWAYWGDVCCFFLLTKRHELRINKIDNTPTDTSWIKTGARIVSNSYLVSVLLCNQSAGLLLGIAFFAFSIAVIAKYITSKFHQYLTVDLETYPFVTYILHVTSYQHLVRLSDTLPYD